MTIYQASTTQTTVVPTSGTALGTGLGSALSGFTGSISLVGGGSLSFWEIYRRQLWVNVAVNKISRGIARLPVQAFDLTDTGDRDRLRASDNALAALVRTPYPRGTTFRYWSQVLVTLLTWGESLSALLAVDAAGDPVAGAAPNQTVPLDWRNLRAYVRNGETRFYEWKRGDVTQVLLPEDVLSFAFAGKVSPIEPLRQTLALEDAAQRSSIAAFENGIVPSGIVSVEKSMKDESFDALEEQLKRKHGGPDKRFRLAVTDSAVKWTPISISATEAALVDQRRLNREEVAAAFDIDPTQIGILDRATFSNVSEAHKRLYMDTFGPILTLLEQDFTAQVIDPWAGSWGAENPFVEFNLDAMLRGDPESRSAAQQRWLNSGVRSPNEIRKLENLPAIEDPRADAIYLPLNLEPVGKDLPAVDRTAAATTAAAGASAKMTGEVDTPAPTKNSAEGAAR